MGSIIVKWKKFRTIRTVHSNKSFRSPQQGWEKLLKRTTISAALHQSGPYCRVARQNVLLVKKKEKGMRQPVYCLPSGILRTQSTKTKIIWSDETRLTQKSKYYIRRTSDTVYHLANTISSIMLWASVSAAGTRRLDSLEGGDVCSQTHRQILEENLATGVVNLPA